MVRLLSILILASTLIGCSGLSAEKPTEIGELTPEQRDGPADYRIAPGDELEIAFFHTPELNTSVIVRPDGKIGLPLAQGLEAAGRTPEELATTLRRIYQAELLEPDVAVNVRTFSAYQIHVGGEVEEPGMFPLVGQITVLDAIFQAGGYNSRSRLDGVLLLRRDAAGSTLTIPINIEEAITGEDPAQNLALLPYDIVLVPPSAVANLNTWIEHYIRLNLPIDFGAGIRLDDL